VNAIIGAQILNIARQDYEPQGASVTMLISEGDDAPIQIGRALSGAGVQTCALTIYVNAIIGAQILNIARQDYEPQGASVTMLISEGDDAPIHVGNVEEPGPIPDSVVAHLNKSHITVHTYPESHPHGGISTFRADIDVSTCGRISPLKALNYLIHSFDSDIVIMDYRVRGFTRDISGQKHFIDHEITSIQNYISDVTAERYQMIDVNVYQENIFHTKMILKDFQLDNYLFETDKDALSDDERKAIQRQLKHEMAEIFYGRNYKLRR